MNQPVAITCTECGAVFDSVKLAEEHAKAEHAITDRIDVNELPRVERADSVGRKDRQG